MRMLFLDTETTGIDPKSGHRIIEIGITEVKNRTVVDDYGYFLLDPERNIEEGSIAIHGITNEKVQGQPTFRDIYLELRTWIDGNTLCMHNAAFDVGFIEHECALLGEPIKLRNICTVIDTLEMARSLHPGRANNLNALAQRYRINTDHRTLHGALIDAQILADVYLAMTSKQVKMFQQSESVKAEAQKSTQNITKELLQQSPVIKATASERALHESFFNS